MHLSSRFRKTKYTGFNLLCVSVEFTTFTSVDNANIKWVLSVYLQRNFSGLNRIFTWSLRLLGAGLWLFLDFHLNIAILFHAYDFSKKRICHLLCCKRHCKSL